MNQNQLYDKSAEVNHTLQSCCMYLEYVGDNCIVMFILFLVELLQVGGVFALTVTSHLVPHLSLLSCLKKKHTHKHIYHNHILFTNLVSPDENRPQTQPEHKNLNESTICVYEHSCICTHIFTESL